ncbi:hypothetical protein ABT023_16370 [Micromonospora sp. NPDC002296]|uniref:hypothetical protein n=1 Tax=Micromonospora sp. NPDC002296 TaxID=3154271 RepID=UPI0033305E47
MTTTTAPTTSAPLALDAIRKLTDAATPGPWTAHPDGLVWSTLIGDPVSGSVLVADANFIAAARTAVPALLAKLAQLCGSCHPCTNYADETWRAAGRTPPHVSQWDEAQAELTRLRAALDAEKTRTSRLEDALADVEQQAASMRIALDQVDAEAEGR